MYDNVLKTGVIVEQQRKVMGSAKRVCGRKIAKRHYQGSNLGFGKGGGGCLPANRQAPACQNPK